MSSWAFVLDLAGRLPGTRLGEARDGSPAYYAGPHAFARLRWTEDGAELLQTWTGDMDTEAVLDDRRDAFPVVQTFRFRVSTWARLDLLDDREVAELVLDSYLIRGPVGRRTLDVTPYLP